MTAEGVVLFAVGAPHVARGADHGGHRGVDDDVARHVEVGDALVGVDHRQPGTVGQALLDGGADIVADAVGQSSPSRIEPSPLLGLRPAASSCSPYAANTSGRKARTTWPKMIGSETFIMVALRCTENRTSSALARAICSARKASRAAARMTVESTTSPSRTSGRP